MSHIKYTSGKMSFENNPSIYPDNDKERDFKAMLEQAQDTLVSTVKNYKNIYGKSEMDHTLLVEERRQHLIWWIFPSEVLN